MVVVLWQNWGEHVGRQLPHFLAGATLTDVTISVGPRSIKAHRIILAFFSPFFKKMLEEVSEERPMVVVFPGINFDALQVIVAYMYRGQVNVPAELLPHVIELAKMLKVKGLIELPAQIDTVIAGSGAKVSGGNALATVDEDPLDLQHESEGLVEFEVTADEQEPPTQPQPPVSHTTSTVVASASVEPTSIHIQDGDQAATIGSAVATRVELSKAGVEEEHQHVLIQPEDIQLSTVDDLTHTQIVKLSEGGGMGEVLFSSDYIHTERSGEEQENDSMCLQEGQDDSPGKKRRKVIYKLARYGPEDLQRALEDVRSGMGTLREIAERWGVPHSTLSVNAKMAGISTQQRNLDYDNDTLEAAKEAVKAGLSYMKVAREYNIPKSVLWRRCQREGILRGELRRCYNYSQEDLKQAKQLLLSGRSLSYIIKEIKIPKTTLFRLKEQLVREGKMPASSITRVARPRRPSETSVQQAVAACKEEGLSQGKASEKFQVSKTTVWRRLKRLKQEDAKPDPTYQECDMSDQQNVKIEVVENLAGDPLGDTYNREITMSYTEEGDLQYVDKISEESTEEKTLECSKYATSSPTEKFDEEKDSGKMRTDKHSAFEVVPKSVLVHTQGQNLVIARSQASFIDSKHLGIFTSEGHVIPTITQDNKDTVEVRASSGNTQFELEMPLMNLPGGGYQVVGSEIVIGGPQMVVLEPSENNPHNPDSANHHLVMASFSQMDGLDELSKVERTLSEGNLEPETPPGKIVTKDTTALPQTSDQ